jgi:hypothetical protein
MTDTASEINFDDRGPARPRLEFWAIDRLVPSPRNARIHSPAQVAEIADSIKTFGFTNPILAGTHGDVIAGPRSMRSSDACVRKGVVIQGSLGPIISDDD